MEGVVSRFLHDVCKALGSFDVVTINGHSMAAFTSDSAYPVCGRPSKQTFKIHTAVLQFTTPIRAHSGWGVILLLCHGIRPVVAVFLPKQTPRRKSRVLQRTHAGRRRRDGDAQPERPTLRAGLCHAREVAVIFVLAKRWYNLTTLPTIKRRLEQREALDF